MNMGCIFISYSSKDEVFARRVAQSVKEWGYSFWMAPDMIPAGVSYAGAIPKAIENCEVFLLLLSESATKSIWVEKELDHALSHGKRVVPLLLDNVQMQGTFQFYLNNVQMIPYKRELREQLEDLERELRNIFYGNVQAAPVMPQATAGKIAPGSGRRKSTNSLRVNKIPVTCEVCGSAFLKNTSVGIYTCLECKHENYDDYQKIRNYLSKVGNAPASVIEQETGVSRTTITQLFKEEFLEIPLASPVRMSCVQCGAPIRSGEICDSCKIKNASAGKLAEKKDSSWHSFLKV